MKLHKEAKREQNLIKDKNKQGRYDNLIPNHKTLIDKALEDFFSEDRNIWPLGRWEIFVNILFKDMELVFNKETKRLLV